MQNKLPERLKKLRADMELSQAKLGTILNIPQQTYDKWEQGKSQPDIETLMRLAYFFDVTLDYLTGMSNDISKIEIGHRAKSSFNNSHINIHNGNKN